MADLVASAVASGKYASKSEFIRDVLRDWGEQKLALELAQSRQELAQGKGKILKSLTDLR